MKKKNGMILLIDVGNTKATMALADGEGIHHNWSCPTGETAREIERLGGPLEGACVCCVVPELGKKLARVLESRLGGDPIFVDHRTDTGVTLDYPRPERLGPDRIANAVAACNLYGAPAIVVDFGTAITFDVIDEKGAYIGGVIAPGVGLTLRTLHEKTALLPEVEINFPERVLGRDTASAILSGVTHGFIGLIDHLIEELIREAGFPQGTAVIVTGGEGETISKKISKVTFVDPLLTLKGLLLIYNRNSGKKLRKE